MAKVLVIRLSAIGDVAMTVPVIYSAAKANPEDSFTVLTQAFLIPLFMNRPSNVEVIGINTKGAEKGVVGLLKFTSALLKFDFDIVLDLHNVIRTIIICTFFRLKGKRVFVVDKARKECRRLTAIKNKRLYPLRPVVVRYADVFRAAGLNYTETFTSLYGESPADLSGMASIAGIKKANGSVSLHLPNTEVKFIHWMRWNKSLPACRNVKTIRFSCSGGGDMKRLSLNNGSFSTHVLKVLLANMLWIMN